MALVLTNSTNYTNIANAIRAKNYTSTTYTPAEMPAAINALEDKITNANKVSVVAKDTIAIGDTIYTVPCSPFNVSGINGTVYTAAFSPDGCLLVLGGDFSCKAFMVYNNTLTYVSDIIPGSGIVRGAAFSPDGTKLILVGDFGGYAKLYTVSGTTFNPKSTLSITSEETYAPSCVAFSPSGKYFAIGGFEGDDLGGVGSVKVYSLSGTTVTYKCDVSDVQDDHYFTYHILSAKFYDDSTLYIGATGGSQLTKATLSSGSCTAVSAVSNMNITDAVYSIDTMSSAKLVVAGSGSRIVTVYNGTVKSHNLSLPDNVQSISLIDATHAVAVIGTSSNYKTLHVTFNSTYTTCSAGTIDTLAGTRKATAVSPNKELLFAGGTSYARCTIYDPTTNQIATKPFAYKAANGVISPNSPNGSQVGYAIENIASGASGTVRTIGTLTNVAKQATATTVSLKSDDWTGDTAPYTQTVAVDGVVADQSKQVVSIDPNTITAYVAAKNGLNCIGQGENSLTFTTETKPKSDINVDVVIDDAYPVVVGS